MLKIMDHEVIQTDPRSATETSGEPDLDWLNLSDDEEILWASTPHKYNLYYNVFVGVLLCFVLIGFVILPLAILGHKNTSYVITNKHIYRKQGSLSQDVKQLEFDKIQNTSFSQGAAGNALGYGSVEISTAGSSGAEMKFRNIPNASGVRNFISELTEKERASSSEDSIRRSDETIDLLKDIKDELETLNSKIK